MSYRGRYTPQSNNFTGSVVITSESGQTDSPLIVVDSAGNTIAQIQPNGTFHNVDGVRTVAAQYGFAFGSHSFGDDAVVQTGTGWYDHVGGTFPQLFTRISGTVFSSANVGDWIIFLTGTHSGAACEIKTYIDADTLLVDGFGWDIDFNTAVSPGSYIVIPHPGFATGDGNKHEFSVGADGEFEIASYAFTGSKVVEIESDVAAANSRTVVAETDCNGYNNTVGLEVPIVTGDLTPGESVACVYAHTDITGATSADATTTVPCYIAGTSNGSDAISKAYLALADFDIAFQVYGATATNVGYGYVLSSGGTVATARTTEFNNAGNDVEIFTDNNDWILIGSDNTFEIVQAFLATESARRIKAQFYYTQGSGTWAALTAIDSTGGFKETGSIVFSAPGDWAKDDETADGDAITNAYYIGIKRTQNKAINTLPVESYFKTFATRAAGMTIYGDGVVQLANMSDAPAVLANGMMWMESDGVHIYRDGAEKVLDDGNP